MSNREFVLWLWGFLELCAPQTITRPMLFIIRNHLNLVRATEGALGEFNQKIHDRISAELASETVAENTQLFDELKTMVSARLIEIEQQAA